MVSRKRGFWLLLLALGLATAGCAGATQQASDVDRLRARDAWERGLVAFRDKQASLALNALQEAIALDGTVAMYRVSLGLLYLELQRPDLALEHLRRATEIDPLLADAHLNLGVALAEAGRWEEAVGAYRRAISAPTLQTPYIVYNNLGLALYHLKRHAEAEEALRFAISLEPQLEAAWYHLGLVLTAREFKDQAKAAFRQVRQLAPSSPFGEAAGERLRALGETQ
jgi:Tfp pilus assembly protein PilF